MSLIRSEEKKNKTENKLFVCVVHTKLKLNFVMRVPAVICSFVLS